MISFSLVAVLSNIWTIFANWFFIDYIGMGFNGAPVARASTCFILAIFMVGYVLIFKKYKETWGTLLFYFILFYLFEINNKLNIKYRWMVKTSF